MSGLRSRDFIGPLTVFALLVAATVVSWKMVGYKPGIVWAGMTAVQALRDVAELRRKANNREAGDG